LEWKQKPIELYTASEGKYFLIGIAGALSGRVNKLRRRKENLSEAKATIAATLLFPLRAHSALYFKRLE
jgi:hypothetical protein